MSKLMPFSFEWVYRKIDICYTLQKEVSEQPSTDSKPSSATPTSIDADKSVEDDDDDDFDTQSSPPSSGGSNIFSLLNLATALFPASGSGGTNVKNNNKILKQLIKDLLLINKSQIRVIQRRQDIADNVIDIDYTADLKPPPFQKQEIDETDDDDSNGSDSGDSEEDNGGGESVEKESKENGNGNSKQDSESNGNGDDDDDDNVSDYDEPPGGDGQGGGILGLLAGLSGDGDSDLGTLLATVGGIVANLSGDGVDINAIVATALGLFVGLLSDGTQNPGEIIGSYLLTSLDTITGGGAKNNGEFFGKFISTLVKGTSAGGDPDASGSDEQNGMKMADSVGFFASLIMGLLGDMSKTSSGGWR
ncbi:protein qua-1 [Helicoverpa zea]|uniref:protein qua-1 n=1 Tax=Helicoverpa zea TaxID=7113 RepID=UPI001F572335|nr:protein qua-1 [Helicoverpa zea]